ncbi:sensor histidine kinase [Hyalangium rubrum]|uniref:ATP-binding protein n=1 Tax=Hyalangium rubrum TaxID=3103134 RepID=A0ABU5H617_9BACT|nr:ATP-binding protein [Hyalangium sp. s54d21]MDY7228534.1 ATP-binding protein [Hyalangium sp. s54d21]
MATMAMTAAARKTLSLENKSPAPRSRPVDADTVSNVVSLESLLRESPVDLVDLAQDVVAQMLTEGRLEQVEVMYHLPEEPVQVNLPRSQLSAVVEQLVASAVEAMKAVADRKHLLRVIVEPADEFGDYGPRLKVQDTGAAVVIEDAMQAAIDAAEQMGAALTVKPRPTGGNMFTVDVPTAKVVNASW